MDPLLLVPTPDTIPIHHGWLQFFLLLTFVVHLLFMNTMLGTGIIALVASIRRTPDDLPVAKQISVKLPTIIAFTVNTGVAPLLFIQVLYGQFIYTSSMLMAVYWLSVFLVLLLAYYAAYIFDFRFERMGKARSWMIAFSVLLFLIVAFIFTNNMTLMISPEKWSRWFANAGGTLLNLDDPTLIPRYLHFVMASVATGGLFLALLWTSKQKRGYQNAGEKADQAIKWFVGGTLAQALVGIWFFLMLPLSARIQLMGENLPATLVLIFGIIAAGVALHLGLKKKYYLCAAANIITIILMVLVRDFLRRFLLSPYFKPSDLEVAPQYGPFALFAVALVAGIFVVIYMIRLALKSHREVPS